ncbi:RNase P subunit p30-domain-containing protein [Pilobolus umbonatus]|nr:RNase P subunit p30-domain-containing protein [Pilobolus umbonatus]
MIYDLNIPYPSNPTNEDNERIEKILERINSMHKSTVALNLTISEGLKDMKRIEPIAQTRFKNLKQLTRVTIRVDNSKKNYQLTSATPTQLIDLLAVRPTSIEVCKHACQNLDVDLISLDLVNDKSLPGFVSSQVAISRGIFFEICYGQAFRDSYKRSTFFTNVKRLVEMTRGHNLIFSSEALNMFEIKRPADLRILGTMYGLTHDQVESAVNTNYSRLMKKAETRQHTYNAVIRIDPPILPNISQQEASGNKRKNPPQNNNPQKKQKKGQKA